MTKRPGWSLTILVVEDDEIIRTITRMILEQEGYAVLEASDGRHALGVLDGQAERPALALIDWNMPIMSGAQLLAAMRADPRFKAIPALVCSASPLALSAGPGEAPVAVLGKPTSPPELVAAVRAALVDVTPRVGA